MSMYPKMDTGQKSIFLGKFLRVNGFRILMPLYCKSQKGGVHDPNWFELVRSVGRLGWSNFETYLKIKTGKLGELH